MATNASTQPTVLPPAPGSILTPWALMAHLEEGEYDIRTTHLSPQLRRFLPLIERLGYVFVSGNFILGNESN